MDVHKYATRPDVPSLIFSTSKARLLLVKMTVPLELELLQSEATTLYYLF